MYKDIYEKLVERIKIKMSIRTGLALYVDSWNNLFIHFTASHTGSPT